MRTWACTNQKGGTARTVTVANVAAALCEKGKRVLVEDLNRCLEDRTSREWGHHSHETRGG